jgi:hypothetical protein
VKKIVFMRDKRRKTRFAGFASLIALIFAVNWD